MKWHYLINEKEDAQQTPIGILMVDIWKLNLAYGQDSTPIGY